tara:strand:- start:799 stop:1125 length:327 start_codon:yes stop_codon:yes gene_type:complete
MSKNLYNTIYGNSLKKGNGSKRSPNLTPKRRMGGPPNGGGVERGWFGDLVRHWIAGRKCECMHSGTGEGFSTNIGRHSDCVGACAGGQGVWVGGGGGGGAVQGIRRRR